MEIEMSNFLSILGKAIHGKYPIPLVQPVGWDKVVSLAKAHKILPLIVQSEMDNGDFASHQIFTSATDMTVSQAVGQIKRTELFKHLYSEMNKQGIFPIVLKGIVCRELYGELGDYRISSDEDILVKKDDFEKIDEFLKSKGFCPDKENISEKQKSFLQEVTYTSADTDLRIEVHLNLMGTEDNLRIKMNTFFEDVFENYREVSSENTKIITLNNTKHFLFLVFHALKHLTVTGFGIRMVCDILLYYEKYEKEINLDFIYDALEKIGGVSFFEDLIYIGNKYLSFSLPTRNVENFPEDLLDDILESGIYGNFSQARRTSAHMVHMAFSERKISSRLGKAGLVFDTIFPKKEKFRDTCPQIDEKPWLVVGEYFKRAGRFIAHSRESKNNLASESIKAGEKRIELLKKYKLL